MKVVFFEEVEGTARVGEIRDVRRGFARNYLLPRGLAGPATRNNLARAEKLAQADALRQQRLDSAASPIASAIAGAELVFSARVGAQGRLFGSITARDIAARLSELAAEAAPDAVVEHRQVQLPHSLRTLGEEEVSVRFTRNVQALVRVVVQADEQSAELSIDEAAAQAEAAETDEEAAGGGDAEAAGSEN